MPPLTPGSGTNSICSVAGSAGQNLLILILSIFAITLTQLVLNQQRRSDLALHLKIGGLITAIDDARDELAGDPFDRTTVNAAAIRELDECRIRRGNRAYAKANKSFGAATA